MRTAALAKEFHSRFGHAPGIGARAPGRVNLIGEHIDYLGGRAAPAAIDREVRVLAARGVGNHSRFYSMQFPETGVIEMPPETSAPRPEAQWANYIQGVAHEFARAGFSSGAVDWLVWSDLPPGSGLSSSAALEVAVATALNAMTEAGLSRREIARLARRAENNFVGVPCGIMDQAAACLGRAGHVLLLDCANLQCDEIPLPGRASLIVAHCGVARNLAGTAYEQRRSECASALEHINAWAGARHANLCDVPMEVFATLEHRLDPVAARRARYALEENARTREFGAALAEDDLERAGRLMNQSHAGLRDLFQVSCLELDALVELTRRCEGVLGSRLSGAGFGGATVTLAERTAAADIVRRIKDEHPMRTSREPLVFQTRPVEGAALLEFK